MTTSEGLPTDPLAQLADLTRGGVTPGGLPSVAELTTWANEFFRDTPATPDAGGVPPSSTPISPALGSGPRTPVPVPPVLSAATATNAGPPIVSPVPVPGVPSVPPAAPPSSPVSELPTSASASPVPMPSLEQYLVVPSTITGIMGFVGAVPFVDEPAAPTGPGIPAPAPAGQPPTPGPVPSESTVAIPGRDLIFRPDVVPRLEHATGPGLPGSVRDDFPILNERVHGKRLIWLDNAATTQKPKAVIDRLTYFYEHENSNIHRAAHTLAGRATDAYESARESARRFLNASSTDEIIFVRGTTEGINLIAKTWGAKNVGEGDEILITWLEHHANIVPWQQLCASTGALLRVAPVDDTGQVIISEYERLITPRTKLVSFTQVSNALGTVTPAAEMIDIAHRNGVPVLLDGAQSVSHMRTDVQALDADFFVMSGHKVFGPTGIGVVYGKKALLDDMPPWQGGGNMIADVTFERTIYHGPPTRFEAGTGNIADAVGLGAALDYVTRIGLDGIAAHEHALLEHATEGLCSIPGLCIIGTAREKAGVISFVLDGHRTEEVGAALDREGIAVRSGHHCAQPILRRFGVESTVRPSFALYNTHEDVDELVAAVKRIQAGTARI